MLQKLRRLVSHRPDGIPHITGQGITGSVSPLPLRGLDINPRPKHFPHCIHCRDFWSPASCPEQHELPCRDCGQDVA